MTTTEFDIESLPVKITYVGETVRDNNWKCDQWRVQLSNKNGLWTTDYFTGLGLRTKRYSGFVNKWDPIRKKHYIDIPKKPAIADVLYSLFMDASAADQNFNDWCDEFGYSDDSLKALNTYKQCLDIATALRKYFSPEQREAIKAIIQEM